MTQPDFQSAWIEQNTALIRKERRAQLRRVAMTVFAIIAGAALASLIFCGAIAGAKEAAEIAPMMMRF